MHKPLLKAPERRFSYRGQFIIGPKESAWTADWNSLVFANRWFLSAHPDLPVLTARMSDTEVVLLGWVFDTANPGSGDNPAERLACGMVSFRDFEALSSDFGGRWVGIVRVRDEARVYPDCGATSAICYTSEPRKDLWIASSASLIAAEPGSHEGPDDRDDWFLKYVAGASASSIGRLTPYAGVRRLLPNHYLDLNERKTRRFWPSESIEPVQLPEAVCRARAILRGQFDSAARQHRLFVGLTGGVDSRVLFACLKTNEIPVEYFYVDMMGRRSEAGVVQELARRFGETVSILRHEEIGSDDADRRMVEIFTANTSGRWPEETSRQQVGRAMATARFMDRSHDRVPGRGESSICFYGHLGEVVRGSRTYSFLALHENDRLSCIDSLISGLTRGREPAGKDRSRISSQLEDWLRDSPLEQNYRLETAFYWEWRIGAWLSDVYAGSDLFYTRVAAYNIRSFCELGLGIERKFLRRFVDALLADIPGLAEHPYS